VFAVVLAVVVFATAASLFATAAVGLIAFVPLAGFAVFPLQAVAWLLRGLVFQYLGLAALGAYLTLFRAHLRRAGRLPADSSDAFNPASASWMRTA
jgi:hypothetical protein